MVFLCFHDKKVAELPRAGGGAVQRDQGSEVVQARRACFHAGRALVGVRCTAARNSAGGSQLVGRSADRGLRSEGAMLDNLIRESEHCSGTCYIQSNCSNRYHHTLGLVVDNRADRCGCIMLVVTVTNTLLGSS